MYKAPIDDNDEWRAALGTLPEVLGPADLETLNEGLRYLFKELREAQTAFVGGSHLDGVYLALVAIYAFVSLFRAAGTEGLMVPLMELESALCALDDGVTEPLLKPVGRAKSGRPPASQLRQEFLGTVAYSVKKLCDLDFPQSEAHKAVADDLNRAGTKPDRGSGQVTPRTVRDWCERVSEDFGRHSPAAKRYDALMADPRTAAFDRMPPETAARLLRRQLVRAATLLGIAQRRRKTT
jgi:hypothetical protein